MSLNTNIIPMPAEPERLAHERLDANRVAIEFVSLAELLSKRLPRTKGQLGDQLARASESIVLRIAEGAGCEWRSAEQKRHFRAARGSVLECAAALDICVGFRPVRVVGQLASRYECAGACAPRLGP